jgi:hypothetical protein
MFHTTNLSEKRRRLGQGLPDYGVGQTSVGTGVLRTRDTVPSFAIVKPESGISTIGPQFAHTAFPSLLFEGRHQTVSVPPALRRKIGSHKSKFVGEKFGMHRRDPGVERATGNQNIVNENGAVNSQGVVITWIAHRGVGIVIAQYSSPEFV